METNLENSLLASGNDMRYDAACKRVLSEKIILAWIMKRCLKEYVDCDVKDIAEKYIEGTPEIMEVPVMPDETNLVKGMNTEDISVTEGTVKYDIRFSASFPDSDDKAYLIINVEAQNVFNPGYSLLKRAFYYCARMISAQKGSVFTGSKYGEIKKVYSIWVHLQPPKNRSNSITRYSVTEENLVGNVKEAIENYDLLSVVNICLGDFGTEGIDQTLKMLDSLFTEELTPAQKKQILEQEFDINMSSDLESEVIAMGNLGQGIYERGHLEGIEKGRAEGLIAGRAEGLVAGRAEGIEIGSERARLENILSVISKTGWTAERVMDFLDVPKSEHKKYLHLLEQ